MRELMSAISIVPSISRPVSGAHFRIPSGAQAMLDLRGTYLNGDWESFWTYHVEKEDDRLYRKFGKTG